MSADENHHKRKGTDDARASLLLDAPLGSLGHLSLTPTWEGRRQKLAMFSCSLYFIGPCALVLWSLTLYGICYGPVLVRTALLMYLIYIHALDRSPTTGDLQPVLRSFADWWQNSCDYLPLLLVKTAELPTDSGQSYLLGYHPHGIISVGCFGAFATDGAQTLDLTKLKKDNQNKEKAENEMDDNKGDSKQQQQDDGGGIGALFSWLGPLSPGKKKRNDNSKSKDSKPAAQQPEDQEPTEHSSSDPFDPTIVVQSPRGFSSLFPGLDRRVVTLPPNFVTPFLREYFLRMGAVTSTKETFRNILAKPSAALVVVVGGASESLETSPGEMDLVLGRRRGFVREAIRANASLVPVLAFGENDLYQTFEAHESEWIGTFQTLVKQFTGIAVPLFVGRSILLADVGIMPQRKPVVVVVGAPIAPPKRELTSSFDPKIDRETDEALNEDGQVLKDHHALYVQALKDLHYKYRKAPWNAPGQALRKSMAIVK